MNMPLTLSDLEDRALAMCEAEFVEFSMAADILQQWFDRAISVAELREVFERLAELGLIECRVGDSWSFTNVVPNAPLIEKASFRATSTGETYLNGTHRKVT